MKEWADSSLQNLPVTTSSCHGFLELSFMSYIILAGIFATIFIDGFIFRQKNLEAVKRYILRPSVPLALLLVALAIILWVMKVEVDLVPKIIMSLTLPFYLFLRWCFLRATKIEWEHSQSQKIFSDALGLILIWVFSVVCFSFLVTSIVDGLKIKNSELGELIVITIFYSLLSVYLIRRASRSFSSGDFLTNLSFKKGKKPRLKIFIIPSLCGFMFACISATIILSRKIQPETPLNDMLQSTQSPLMLLTFLFVALMIAPFIEELTFRGYFYHVLRGVFGMPWTIVVISLTFAFLHVSQYWGDWLAIMMVTILGFALTIVRAWSGSTLASTVMHYVYNSMVTIIPVIFLITSNPAYFKYRAYYDTIDSKQKESLLLESIEAKPEFADAYNDLAWLYAEEERDLDLALDFVHKAMELSPENTAYIDTKAEVLTKMGRWEAAIEVREDLLEMDLNDESAEYQFQKLMDLEERGGQSP